MMKGFYKLIYL